VAPDDPTTHLPDHGIALFRGAFSKDLLSRLQQAAARCFGSLTSKAVPPDSYQFNRFSHSVLLTALADFGCDSEELLAPLSTAGLGRLFSDALNRPWTCRMEQSWVRQKFAPSHVPDSQYRPHSWHQDGALGQHFPLEPGPVIPMTDLLTCWIPLTVCGTDSPGLEFVRRRQAALLHFTELDDAALRRRFPQEAFWVPALEVGDGLVFPGSTLHQTYARPEMRQNRLSVEYRIFPR
jgi:hypothetical protein